MLVELALEIPRFECCPFRRGNNQRCRGNRTLSNCLWPIARFKQRNNVHPIEVRFEIVLWMIFDFLVLTMFSLAIGALFGFGLSYLFKVN